MRPLFSRLFVCVLALSVGSTVGRSGAATAEPVDIGPTLAAVTARRDIPGMTAIVLRGDQVIAQGAAGVRKKGAAELVLLTDKFQIASNAKPMSAFMLAMLIEEGRLRWDSTLSEIFGNTLPGMNPAWRGVTLRQLMDHRSGLASDPLALLLMRTLFSTASATRQRLDVAEHLLARAPQHSPGTKFAYTSAAYVILAAAMEKATGRAWEDLMRERLFGPLGMASVGIGAPASPHRLDQPWGHGFLFHGPVFGLGRSDTPLDPASMFASVPRSVAPAGVLHMSTPDWAKFVALVLRGHPANPARRVALLGGDTFARLYEPEPRNETPRGSSGDPYAGNWVVSTRSWAKGSRPGDSGILLWNQGDDTRWHSTAYIAPELDFAVVVACNRTRQWEAGHEAAEALVSEFARDGRLPGSGLGGRWEGLIGGQRVVLDLPGREAAAPEGMLLVPDQKSERIPVTGVAERDGAVRFETGKGGVFEGTLSGDQSALAGTWKQGKFGRWVVLKRSAAKEER